MESGGAGGFHGYRLGPRIPVPPVDDPVLRLRHDIKFAATMTTSDVPSRIMARADATTSTGSSQCSEGSTSNLCEKPIGSQSMTIPIVLGIAVPIICAVSVLVFLHRRTVKKQKKEDAEDPHKSLDFGMVEARLNKSGPKRKSMFGVGEKSNSAKHRQLSMDMNLSSPYLLPPGLQGSRESLHSLARTLHQDEDPYRPVAKYSGDAGSIRSSRRGGEADSMHTGSSKNSGWRSATPVVFPPRQNSLPKPPPPAHQNDPFYKETGLSSQDTHHQNDAFYKETGLSAQDTRSPPVNTPSPPAKDLFASRSASPSPPPQRPAQPDSQQAPMLPYPEDKDSVAMRDLPQLPSIQEPPPVAQVPSRGLPNSPRPGEQSPPQRKPSYDTSMERLPTSPRAGEKSSPQTQRKLSYDASMEMDEFAGRQQTNNEPPRLSDPSTVSSFHHEQQFREPTLPNVSSEPQPPASPPRNSPPSSNSLPANPRPARSLTPPKISPEFPETIPEEPAAPPAGQHSRDTSQNYYDDDYYYGDGQQQTNSQHHSEEFPTRGRSLRRQSAEFVGYYDEQQQGGGLAVPQQDVKRLSVGFRPLPPEDIMDLEDPEYRANRIRSFYKEYFDETKQEGFQPPPLPQNNYDFYQNQQQQQYPQQYYEDYDQHYLGEQAHNNQAYYNQPYYDPNAHSFVMPYAQPVQRRAMTPPPSNRMHGPGQRRWHGSVGGMSLPGGRGGPHFRPGSAASSRWGGGHHPMRPGSSISNRYNGGPANKKPMGPPPAPLSTLPNPAKLKDDSFAIMNAIDFAPPDSFSDRVAGRSQSPAGERRPYKPKVPVHLPTVSAFDELATLPSPYMLRKSGTFTALDFAPPRRFKSDDSKSDAGSIRSNRSGISTAQLSAIRAGAGRVSRLPGDQIFTAAQAAEVLRPQWGMRP